MLNTVGFYAGLVLCGALVATVLIALGAPVYFTGMLTGLFEGAIIQKYRGVL